MMLINGFLGEVVGLENVLGEFSYNFAVYGTPDVRAPWGWQLYGHHCAVNCLVVEGRMSIAPVFHGADPNEIDAGPYSALRPFDDHVGSVSDPIAYMRANHHSGAVIYDEIVDPAMPEGPIHPGDERQLAGAFQDNRVIPYEGVQVATLDARSQEAV